MSRDRVTLVIARYTEDLEWLTEVPSHFKVVVYNKGPLIESLSALDRIDVLKTMDNAGRESGTYLHHIQTQRDDANEWTVFCQGNPFDHSPDFLKLLHQQARWKDVQPLSFRWLEEMSIPPAYLLERETDEYIGDLRIRAENFSLYLWSATRFPDPGSLSLQNEYARIYGLPMGANIASHFLSMGGLDELAEKAEPAECGNFAYGAIFAVRTRLLAALNPAVTSKLIALARGPAVHGYVFERLWLHFFGAPFLSLVVDSARQRTSAGEADRNVMTLAALSS